MEISILFPFESFFGQICFGFFDFTNKFSVSFVTVIKCGHSIRYNQNRDNLKKIKFLRKKFVFSTINQSQMQNTYAKSGDRKHGNHVSIKSNVISHFNWRFIHDKCQPCRDKKNATK